MSNNISFKGENILLNAKKTYYVIDALYLNDIRAGFEDLNQDRLDQEIREKIFPYTDAPFAKVLLLNSVFHISNIKKANHNDLLSDEKSCFSSDTGLILLIEETLLASIIRNYNYEDLIDSLTEPINLDYWKNMTSILANGIGLILAPGVGSGYDFEGSGFYKLIQIKQPKK